MNRRDIITGVIILVLVVVGVLWFRNRASKEALAPSSNQEQIERSFNLTIPDDVDTADLTDVSGGDGSGVATRKVENGTFTHMVLVDLPDSATGTFYEGWLARGKMGDNNFAYISTGKLRVAKGGYLLEFQSKMDYSDYSNVLVTLEKVNDKTPETYVLEGSF